MQTTFEEETRSFASRLGTELPDLETRDCDKWIAWAPGSIDVMGGIAEYTGGLTLSASTQSGVLVAVIPRNDQRLRVVCLDAPGRGHRDNGRVTEAQFMLSSLYGSVGVVAGPEAVRELGRQLRCTTKLAAVSVAHGLLESKLAPHLGGGFSIVIESCMPEPIDCRETASVQAATARALSAALGLDVGLRRLAELCHRAQNAVMPCQSGIATQAGPLMGRAGRLLPICCRPFEVDETMEVPHGVTIAGIHCGARHRLADEKYTQARTAALMGREIIRRLMAVTGGDRSQWGGYLARISVSDYIERFRDRLPTKLKGGSFLERFDGAGDQTAAIDPHVTYKVRSRAEHHIYEDDRVRQFAECLARAGCAGEKSALIQAGELMYASHWSYGQRCGLGSIETDLLVNLLRGEGAKRGIYGARVSGPGAGGTVVVLMSKTSEADDAVRRSINAYQQRSKRTASLQPISEVGGPEMTVEHCV